LPIPPKTPPAWSLVGEHVSGFACGRLIGDIGDSTGATDLYGELLVTTLQLFQRRVLNEDLRGRALGSQAIVTGHHFRLDEAEFLARRALACGTDAAAEVLARSALCWINLGRGRLEMAVDEARRVGEANLLAPPEAQPCFPWMYQALASIAVDDFAAAERCVAVGKLSAGQGGLGKGGGLAQLLAGQLKLHHGDFEGALADSESTIGSPGVEALAQTVIATVRIHQGALEAARQHVLMAADLIAGLDVPSVRAPVRFVQARLWAAEGRPADGVTLLDGLYRNPQCWVVLIVTDPGMVPTLVRLARDAGVPGRAGRLVSVTEQLAAANGDARSLRAAALHARGLAEDNIDLLLEATSLGDGGPRRLAAALAREDAAWALAARGEVDRAAQLYCGALAGYTGCGATHAARRVRSRLRASGVRCLPAQGRGRPAHGWASLSDVEMEVVRLVTEGLTNRAIADRLCMSRHTVDSHLRHVFVKLGVTSRVALTRSFIGQADCAGKGRESIDASQQSDQ
jgi:DNA-binding CsgD family transcriptional regulator